MSHSQEVGGKDVELTLRTIRRKKKERRGLLGRLLPNFNATTSSAKQG